MLYPAKVRFLKTRYGWALGRRWQARDPRGRSPLAEDLIRRFAPGRSVADVGGMWGIDGEYGVKASESGATRVVLVDVMEPTPAFEAKRTARAPGLEMVHGEIDDPAVLERVGAVDVVWCFGVLYHHPNPHQLLTSLRGICRETLLLESLTIPEVPGLPQAAVYFPSLSPGQRRLWDTSGGGAAGVQYAINRDYDPELTFVNNFWGLSPSCVRGLLRSVGFEVLEVHPSFSGRLRHVFVCR